MNKKSMGILALVLALMLFSSAMASSTYDPGMFFTHPELGEQMLVDFHNGNPEIIIYGLPYYVVVDTTEDDHRGLTTGNVTVAPGNMPTPETTLQNIQKSSTAPKEGEKPFTYEYAGLDEGIQEKLNALPEEEKIDTLMKLYGFQGQDGFDSLKEHKGFEDMDTSSLKENYKEYTIVIDGVTYPYRIIMIKVTEEGGETYFERYSFVYYENDWHLARITQEYVESYDERVSDIYGMPLTAYVPTEDIDIEALRSIEWTVTQDELLVIESGKKTDNTISVGSVEIYNLVANLNYVFDDEGKLSCREFILTDKTSYYSAFVSLYMRYGDPVDIDDKNMTWMLDDLMIVLDYDKDQPVISYYPRTAE